LALLDWVAPMGSPEAVADVGDTVFCDWESILMVLLMNRGYDVFVVLSSNYHVVKNI